MDAKKLGLMIRSRIESDGYEYTPYEDYYGVSREVMKDDREYGLGMLRGLCERILVGMDDVVRKDVVLGRKLMGLHRRVLLCAAPYDFDSFLQYVEWDRDPKNKFYLPRRKQLKIVVDAMQDLAEGKLKLLGVTLPPGVGKSTLELFYVPWRGGRNPEKPILVASHSNAWVRGAYDECLRILSPTGEYLWHDVFPDVPLTNTNAKECRIDLGKRKRFETIQMTSLGSGNAGLYRAVQLMCCDDLVSGEEVALSRERLDKLWGLYTVDLRQRKLGDECGELHIATHWSVHDVLSRLERMYDGDPKVRFINIPALDENDESNFDYPYGLGYDTKTLHEQREIMDDIEWRTLFMGNPIEREGLLYNIDELRRYFELPDGEPDAIIAVCDTKTKGTDYCVMPVAYQYGPDFYIDGVICDNSNPDVIEPRLASILTERNVQLARFESNQAGGKIAEKIQGMVKELGGRAKLTTKYTTANKETRIIVASPWVLEHCLFKDDSIIKGDKEYRRFLQFLCGYTMAAKNKHDDVPDAMALLSEYIQSFALNKVEIVKRPF